MRRRQLKFCVVSLRIWFCSHMFDLACSILVIIIATNDKSNNNAHTNSRKIGRQIALNVILLCEFANIHIHTIASSRSLSHCVCYLAWLCIVCQCVWECAQFILYRNPVEHKEESRFVFFFKTRQSTTANHMPGVTEYCVSLKHLFDYITSNKLHCIWVYNMTADSFVPVFAFVRFPPYSQSTLLNLRERFVCQSRYVWSG